MTTTDHARPVSRWQQRVGWTLSLVVVAQLLSSAWFRGTQYSYAIDEIVKGYGYPESAIVRIVIAECVLVVLYLIPRTSVLAAILLSGYLGGAVGAHVRVSDMARAAVPLTVGLLAWSGLYLRDRRIRALIPFRHPS